MKSIPITRARHATNFAIALEQYGVPVEPELARSHLPEAIQETINGDVIVSAISMLDFAEKAALNQGILDLGFHAGTVPVEGYGKFGKRVASSASLYDAIYTFCSEVRGECSEADYFLTQSGKSVWFCHGPVGDNPFGLQQHELYALSIMLQVIQLALGTEWHPARVRLQATNESALSGNDFLLNTKIEFGAPLTAIEFPRKFLARPLSSTRNKTPTRHQMSGRDENTAIQSNDPLVALHQLITSCIRESNAPTIESAAELVGVSKRSLQRFLRSKSTTYTGLVDQIRFNMALPLLNDDSVAITEIAYELGYSNVAHFSRAFRRITGMSPRAYRHVLK